MSLGTGSRAVVVSPARDEAGTIGRVVSEALAHFEAVIVVDDGSLDQTAEAALSSGAILVRHKESRGYGAALASGIQRASELGASAVVLLDGDGAHSSDDGARLLLQHRLQSADLTIGSRFLTDQCEVPSSKRSANGFATALFNEVVGTSISDAASGLRVLGERAFRIVAGAGPDFGAAFEIAAAIFEAKFRIVESPISVRYDASEFLGTSALEIRQFLAFCAKRSNPAISKEIALMLSLIERGHDRIGIEVAGRTFFLHRVASHSMYLFQEQDRWFSIAGANFRVNAL